MPTLYAWRIVDYWKWTNRPNPDDYELTTMRTVGEKGRSTQCQDDWRERSHWSAEAHEGWVPRTCGRWWARARRWCSATSSTTKVRLVAKELGDAARYVHLDVTKPEQWESAVATAVGEFGGVDVLVNNAGILNVGTFEDYEISEWQRILDINLTGVFLGIRAVVKPMKEAGGGSIINISSIEGLAGTMACHGYTATKFGVRGLTKSAAMELGQSGIRVNSIHPGLVKTPMTEWVPDDIFQTALGRAADPREVSNLVVYLASDESSYSTGSEFVVDGGTVAGLGHKDFSAVDVAQQPDWVT